MKKDSRKRSALEVTFDVVVGMSIATILNYTILPHYIDVIQSGDFIGMLSLSAWYVAVSFIRKYCLRRWFVKKPKILGKL